MWISQTKTLAKGSSCSLTSMGDEVEDLPTEFGRSKLQPRHIVGHAKKNSDSERGYSCLLVRCLKIGEYSTGMVDTLTCIKNNKENAALCNNNLNYVRVLL